MLSKRHFKTIARILQSARDSNQAVLMADLASIEDDESGRRKKGAQAEFAAADSIIDRLTEELGGYFDDENPRFNWDKFRKVAGYHV